MMNERNRLRVSAGGGPPPGVRPGLTGLLGRGRRRAVVAVVAAGAAALGAVLAFPGNSGLGASDGVAAADAAFSGGRVAGAAAPGDAMAPAAVPELSWAPCDGDLQCATARVPLDYRQPGGAQVSIQLIRHLAADPAHRIGSLFVNAGGPSAQVGLFPDEVLPALPAAVEARYDVVTFDPRGFGHSTPVRCFPSGAAENAFLAGTPAFPAGAAQQVAYERTFARFDALCGQRNGSLLDHDTSADAARDMDLLRQAVHDPVMNYLGVSYGTGIGEVYANLFPGKVGRMLLDAGLDPVTWSSDDQALPELLRDGTAQAAAQGMTGFLTLCGQASTPGCAFSAGSSPATRAKWNALLDRLLQHPVTIGSPPQAITYASLIAALPPQRTADWQQEAVLLQQVWLALGSAPAPAAAGGSLAASAGSGSPAGPAGGAAAPAKGVPAGAAGSGSPALPSAYTGEEQSAAVVCSDSSNPRNAAAYPAIAESAAARFGGFGALETWADEPCAQWAGQRVTGPLHRAVEPANGQSRPGPRQHRRYRG